MGIDHIPSTKQLANAARAGSGIAKQLRQTGCEAEETIRRIMVKRIGWEHRDIAEIAKGAARSL